MSCNVLKEKINSIKVSVYLWQQWKSKIIYHMISFRRGLYDECGEVDDENYPLQQEGFYTQKSTLH